MNDRTCSVEGCDRERRRKSGLGMCGMHYQRVKSGKPLTDPPMARYGDAPCRIDGCDSRPVGDGLCSAHWQRSRKPGYDMSAPIAARTKGLICYVEGCEKAAKSLGLCPMHRERLKRHGDVTTVKTMTKGAPCPVEGCGRPHYAHGYCNMHSRRLNSGKPLDAPSKVLHRGACEAGGCDRHGRYGGYCSTHRDRLKYAMDPEPFKARVALRRQRSVLPSAEDRDLAMEYRYAIRNDPCSYCGRPGASDVDHIYPLSKGGTNHWWNLTKACDPCNSEKWSRCGTWFRLRKGYLSVPARPATAEQKADSEHRRIA